MIAIDTNVLLRYLLNDDPIHSKISTQLIQGCSEVLITDVVLTECVWTLRGKKYKLGKREISDVINALFSEPNIRFENGQVIWKALGDYMNSEPIKVGKKKKIPDFSDALIINKASFVAEQEGLDLQVVYTFDKAAQQLKGVEEP